MSEKEENIFFFKNAYTHKKSMFRSARWDTIVWVIVAVTILSWLLLSISIFLMQSTELQGDFESASEIYFLKSNAQAIGRSVDTSILWENETFSLRRDEANGTYIIYTGSLIDSGAYIDVTGRAVDDINSSTDDRIYRRIYLIERRDTSLGVPQEIIKWSLQELIR